ncbi:hypothetical protein Pmani_011026 [Petrolisthes manimaculis]|uniref:Transmembrane protein n=1 Tax=Petrolisthes manimaculis TaxID=1843537 RepID=A0AAE1UG43_9EUCA|nr:hypothetical protein Pmani_011026 [Petrolisthes manimaculis]
MSVDRVFGNGRIQPQGLAGDTTIDDREKPFAPSTVIPSGLLFLILLLVLAFVSSLVFSPPSFSLVFFLFFVLSRLF